MRSIAIISVIVVMITFAVSHGVFADLSGYVIDKDGAPIKSAKIKLKREKEIIEKTKTDTEGFFTFGDVKTGEYTMIVKKKGYNGTSETVNYENGDDVQISVTMTSKNSGCIDIAGKWDTTFYEDGTDCGDGYNSCNRVVTIKQNKCSVTVKGKSCSGSSFSYHGKINGNTLSLHGSSPEEGGHNNHYRQQYYHF